jgi:SAM-dependent methyltransferase
MNESRSKFPPNEGMVSETEYAAPQAPSREGTHVPSGDFGWASSLTDDKWTEFISGTRQIDGHVVPPLPPAETQRMFVGSDGLAAFREVAYFWNRVRTVLSASGTPINSETKILDFGVGWGRLYRYLLREISTANLTGVDVDGKAIAICSQAMPYGTFLQVPPSPPYPFRRGEFDLIVLYSIFSHLSESLFRSIIADFGRIVKPGGSVAFTSLKSAHLKVWSELTRQPYWQPLLARLNFDPVEWERKLQAGQFLFMPTGGGDPSRPSDFYGEAIVTEAFLRSQLERSDFEVSYFSDSDDAPQVIVVLRRR